MDSIEFVKKELDDVASAVVLAQDATSWLIGIEFDNGERKLAVVYDPSVFGQMEVEVGDEVVDEFTAERPATTWQPEGGSCIDPDEATPRDIRCKLEAPTLSPIERILERQRDAETRDAEEDR